MKRLDVAIAGCGPAGLAAALFLDRIGCRVSLFDQFEAPQPVGSGLLLQPTGLIVLDALGLRDRIKTLGQPISRLLGHSAPRGRIALDVRFGNLPDKAQALAVHRSALFNVLFDAVSAHEIDITTGARLEKVDTHGDGRPTLVTETGRRHGPFDLLIDATGARSSIRASTSAEPKITPLKYGALWATVDWDPNGPFQPDVLAQRYQRASRMVGVLPVGRRSEGGEPVATFFWSLKAQDYDAWRNRGLDAWREDVAAIWPDCAPLVEQVTDPDQLTLARYAHFTLKQPILPRIAFVGDSAHATSPQLGQGANMALLDAMALARALEHSASIEQSLQDYAAARRRHVRLYQAMSSVFTPVFQSDSYILPLLRDWFSAPMTRVPGVPRLLAEIVAGRLIDPLAAMPDAP
ncbi:MAG: NAD(P)/FAD-dependent oxidoreductase [Pseudomonadota bacterium]